MRLFSRARPAAPKPAPAATAADALTDAAARAQAEARSAVASFIVTRGLPGWGTDGSDLTTLAARFTPLLPEALLQTVGAFAADPGNGEVADRMLATVLLGMASRYRGRRTSEGIDWRLPANLALLAQEFILTSPPESVTAATGGGRPAVAALLHRFEELLAAVKPQDLSEVPHLGSLQPAALRRLKAALAVANALHSLGAPASARHRETELLDAVEEHFERRAEVAELLRRMPAATAEDIRAAMSGVSAPLMEGFL